MEFLTGVAVFAFAGFVFGLTQKAMSLRAEVRRKTELQAEPLTLGPIEAQLLNLTPGERRALIKITLQRFPAEEGSRRASSGSRFLGRVAWMLPNGAAERYAEEWSAELFDMREEGERWYRRLGYILVIACISVPRLAVVLRFSRSKVVD
jgi:hypothetical protein